MGSVAGDLTWADAEVQSFDETCDAEVPEEVNVALDFQPSAGNGGTADDHGRCRGIPSRYEARSLQSKEALHRLSDFKW